MDFEHRIGMPTAEQAPPGHQEKMPVAERHYVLNAPLPAPLPGGPRKRTLWDGLFLGC